jgi:uncharacterized protein YcaQ
LATEREIKAAFHLADLPLIRETLHRLDADGEIVSVRLFGREGEYFTLPEMLDVAVPSEGRSARILSPFDNLTIQRNRLASLFGFEYAIECYLPAAKRRYGYFVLPLLWGTEMIGRMDVKADRAARVLTVCGLWFEPTFSSFDEALPSLAEELARFAQFNRCPCVELGQIRPAGHKRKLAALVKLSPDDRTSRQKAAA